MDSPFLLAQLSDLHLGADWAEPDAAARLREVVEFIRALPQQPEALLVSGDIADHAADHEYREARQLLAPLRVPIHVLPGNHDDRATLRRHFDLPGAGAEPVRYSVALGPLQLVVLDSTIPGEAGGELDGPTARVARRCSGFGTADGPGGFVLHALGDGELTSHIEAVGFRHA